MLICDKCRVPFSNVKYIVKCANCDVFYHSSCSKTKISDRVTPTSGCEISRVEQLLREFKNDVDDSIKTQFERVEAKVRLIDDRMERENKMFRQQFLKTLKQNDELKREVERLKELRAKSALNSRQIWFLGVKFTKLENSVEIVKKCRAAFEGTSRNGDVSTKCGRKAVRFENDAQIIEIPSSEEQVTSIVVDVQQQLAQREVPATSVCSPHLQVIDKLFEIPMFSCAYNTGAGVYRNVKGSNRFLGWTLGCAEGAATLGLSAVTPVACKLQGPLQYVDSALCKGLDVVQDKVPIINKPPQEILVNASQYVSSSTVEKVQHIKSAGMKKANEVLTTTSVGSATLASLDKTMLIADQVIDLYLPAGDDEDNVHPHPASECEDKVSHAAHTVVTVSTKMGRRVIRSFRRRNSRTLSVQSDASSSGETSVHTSDEE